VAGTVKALTPLQALAAAALVLLPASESQAAETRSSLPEEAVDEKLLLCGPACAAKLASAERITLPSGLQYVDIAVGTGPEVEIGFQARGGKAVGCGSSR